MEPRQGIRRLLATPQEQRLTRRVRRLRAILSYRPRSTSSRCAVIRHQALRLPSIATSVAIVGPGQVRPAVRDRGRRLRPDPPDPPAVVPAAEVDRAPRRFGHELGMLDQLAVHVDDVERPVGTVRQVDRPERRVGRRQELPALLGPPGDERHARPARARGGAPGSPAARRRRRCRDRRPARGRRARSVGPQLALKNATDSRLNRGCGGLIGKIRPPSAMSRIDATDEVSARYGLRSSACCSSTTWRIGIVFHDGKRLPQSSCGRPNWLKPAIGLEPGRRPSPASPDRRSRMRHERESQVAAADRDGLAGRIARRSGPRRRSGRWRRRSSYPGPT